MWMQEMQMHIQWEPSTTLITPTKPLRTSTPTISMVTCFTSAEPRTRRHCCLGTALPLRFARQATHHLSARKNVDNHILACINSVHSRNVVRPQCADPRWHPTLSPTLRFYFFPPAPTFVVVDPAGHGQNAPPGLRDETKLALSTHP